MLKIVYFDMDYIRVYLLKSMQLMLVLMVSGLLQSAFANEGLITQVAQQIEEELKARVGIAVLDVGSKENWGYNSDDRFPMNSTFKVFACAALLAYDEAGSVVTHQKVRIKESELLSYSPVTQAWVGQEITLGELCSATMRTSDNTAANKILEALGGPDAITAFLRSIGDEVTRLDRWEPDLNEAIPTDIRDTTTPAASVSTLYQLLIGDALSGTSKQQLMSWLISNEVGEPLLRSAIPDNWLIGDRTGAGGYGSRGVIGIIIPPERAPIIVSVYITETQASMERRNKAIAEIGRALIKLVAH